MKKLLLFALTISLFACSKDDKPKVNYYEQALYGKWAPRTVSINGVTFPYDDHEACGKDYIEFQIANIFRSVDVFQCIEEVDDQGNYTVSENIVVVNSTSGTIVATITVLTATELVFTGMQDIDGDGTEEQVTNTFDRI